MDPKTGIGEHLYVLLDFQNAYNIIGICGVAQETDPFDFVLHVDMDNTLFFSDVILTMVAYETLVHAMAMLKLY
jgi:hypothetical protein